MSVKKNLYFGDDYVGRKENLFCNMWYILKAWLHQITFRLIKSGSGEPSGTVCYPCIHSFHLDLVSEPGVIHETIHETWTRALSRREGCAVHITWPVTWSTATGIPAVRAQGSAEVRGRSSRMAEKTRPKKMHGFFRNWCEARIPDLQSKAPDKIRLSITSSGTKRPMD